MAGHRPVPVVHAPLVDQDRPNPLELFQIWLNLPAASKFVEPSFTMLADRDIPRLVSRDGDGPAATVTVIAGGLPGIDLPMPPPDSWAARAAADVAIWHIVLDAGARWVMPPAAGLGTVRTRYIFAGNRDPLTHRASTGRLRGRHGQVR